MKYLGNIYSSMEPDASACGIKGCPADACALNACLAKGCVGNACGIEFCPADGCFKIKGNIENEVLMYLKSKKLI